ncbi:MAG TPA: hypothetical protein VIC62_15195 [Nakamurella sp.]|jgi:methylglyoxal synthase
MGATTSHTVRRIPMVAHDNKKVDLLTWAEFNRDTLAATNCSRPAPPAR